MIKSITTTDPNLTISNSNGTQYITTSGQVCYDHITSRFCIIDILSGSKTYIEDIHVSIHLNTQVHEMINWFNKMQLEELEASKNPAVKEAYDHYQLVKKLST